MEVKEAKPTKRMKRGKRPANVFPYRPSDDILAYLQCKRTEGYTMNGYINKVLAQDMKREQTTIATTG